MRLRQFRFFPPKSSTFTRRSRPPKRLRRARPNQAGCAAARYLQVLTSKTRVFALSCAQSFRSLSPLLSACCFLRWRGALFSATPTVFVLQLTQCMCLVVVCDGIYAVSSGVQWFRRSVQSPHSASSFGTPRRGRVQRSDRCVSLWCRACGATPCAMHCGVWLCCTALWRCPALRCTAARRLLSLAVRSRDAAALLRCGGAVVRRCADMHCAPRRRWWRCGSCGALRWRRARCRVAAVLPVPVPRSP